MNWWIFESESQRNIWANDVSLRVTRRWRKPQLWWNDQGVLQHEKRQVPGSKGRAEEGSTLLWSECLCPPKVRWGFGSWFGCEGGALMNGISILINETPQSPPASFTTWEQGKKTLAMNQEEGLTEHYHAGALTLAFSASRTVSYAWRPLSTWHPVTAAWTN